MDITKATDPPVEHIEPPAEVPVATVPPSDVAIAPFGLEENPNVRTKLRLYTILAALYVPSLPRSISLQ
jgi:hypothetical protein